MNIINCVAKFTLVNSCCRCSIRLNHIFLNNNEIASLDEKLFLGLKNLKKIWLHNNNFTTDRLTLSLEQSVEFVSFKTDQTDNNSDSIDFTKFGNYKKMNPIGQGTFGTVYRVEKDNKKLEPLHICTNENSI